MTTNETVTRSESQGPAPVKKPQRRGVFAAGQYIPYTLLLPAVLALVGVLAYPVYRLIDLAFQNVNRYALLAHPERAEYIGFDGFTRVLSDNAFWEVVLRSIYFTAELVFISMALSMLIALLLNRVSNWVRVTVITVMMFVWAIPALVNGQIFRWLFSSNGGVVDYIAFLITGDETWKHYDWFADPTVGLYVVGAAVIIWGALPFLVLGLYAALTQVPKELMEAAKLDGANPFQAFRHVTIPVIRPFLMISAALSFIWDFQVFAQIYSLRNAAPEPGYRTIGTYLYQQGIVSSRYSEASVISIVMILMMLAVLVFYIRQMLKIGANER
ncbi:putative chitobiose ABC transporter permease protein [Kitasatospora setae KM-6054]|uniref:Putative chitobiose ABC transporter permease protein n=1 Tax=Kitasatospora setae (strain ATCC 33774 / DSM 43861 / JCM 3304 / KCC A-0304 / NBRC 14216 / KM-6054) TaxID=452652 RepID=E4NGT5_KITSK|nr:putative chitobiose ABC transporter permease protein [Kitasatospora setae KM-6054]